MSQFYQAVTAGSLPPSVPTSFVTDNGTVIPAANIVNVNGGPGVSVIANPNGSNNMVINLVDATLTGTATTTDGVTYVSFSAPANVPLATANTAVSIRANLVGIDIVNGLAVGGELIGLAKNISGVLSIVGTPDITRNNDIALSAWTADLAVSGTNIQVQVRGVAAHIIQWKTILDYVIAP